MIVVYFTGETTWALLCAGSFMNDYVNYFLQYCLIIFVSMGCIHIFLRANNNIPKDVRYNFYWLTVVLMLESIEGFVDHILSLLTVSDYNMLRMLVSAFGYIVRPLMLYFVMLIMTRESKVKARKILYLIPTIVTFIVVCMAFFTKWVFYYDEHNNFHGGPLRYVFFVVLAVYFLMILVASIVGSKRNRTEGRIMFAVVGLLSIDWVMAIVFDVIGLHAEIEAFSVVLYFLYFASLFHAEKMEEKTKEYLETENKLTKTMLDQCIETLAYTIDAKDRYTKGHSSRVAKYSRMIALVAGKDEEECRQIYLAGLLHDIGKISISGAIINKDGKLTDEEYEKIKSHPLKGALILDKMKSIPYLQVGAKYHHERFDGRGYPTGLKGTEIPDIARIIAVADAYDAMTSYRSYRSTMDQCTVKQEIWKGQGTQFDPYYSKLMISLIDADPDYNMREFPNKQDDIIFDDYDTKIVWPSAETKETLKPAEHKSMQSEGITTFAAFIKQQSNWYFDATGYGVSNDANNKTKISFVGTTNEDASLVWCTPTIIIFASDNGELLGPNYDELGVFVSAGYGWQTGLAENESYSFVREEGFINWDNWISQNKKGLKYTVSAIKENDTVIISIENGLISFKGRLTLQENYNRQVSIALATFQGNITI